MQLADPLFPPLLTGHAVKSPRLPFPEACRRAAEGELGAGDLVWSRSLLRAELAVVLEPEVDAAHAQQMGPLMLVAAGDCLGALLPPQVPIHYRWPATLLINHGEAGQLSLAMASIASDTAVPDWLVVGFGVDIAFPARGQEPGAMAHRTVLAEEGGGDLDRTRILESLSAHLLTWLNIWQDEGFRLVHETYMSRLEGGAEMIEVEYGGERLSGKPLGLDEAASLLLRPAAGAVRALGLMQALASKQPR